MTSRPTVRVNGYICSHPAVVALAEREGTDRPIEEIVRALAREKLMEADALLHEIDERWRPPPFDPALIAQALGMRCMAVDDPGLKDAMLCLQDGVPTILYHARRTKARTRFSIFHEIAHTLFPDYHTAHRYRWGRKRRMFEPEDQLEYLCDQAAAELMMPMDYFKADLERRGFGAEQADYLSKRYGASAEAVCLRMIDTDLAPCALALFVRKRRKKYRNRKHLAFLPDYDYTPDAPDASSIQTRYVIASQSLREGGGFLQKRLTVDERSCIGRSLASNLRLTGEEVFPSGRGASRPFFVETLPLSPSRNAQAGSALAFLYPAS